MLLRLTLKFAVMLALLGCFALESYACQPLPVAADTKRGWMTIEIEHKKPLRLVRGLVVNPVGDALAGAYVELFRAQGKSAHKRIAGCEIEDDGRFYLPKIPAGQYRLVVSANGFDTWVIHLRVLPRGSRRKLTVRMELSN